MSDRGIGPLVGRAGVPHMVPQALRCMVHFPTFPHQKIYINSKRQSGLENTLETKASATPRGVTVSIVGGRNENNFLGKTINDHQDRGVLY